MMWFLPRSDPGATTEYLRPNGCGVSTENGTLLPYGNGCTTLSAYQALPYVDATLTANGGAKVDHGSGGMVPLRRSKTLPLWQPFPVMGRAGGFIPWSCIARSVWRAGTG